MKSCVSEIKFHKPWFHLHHPFWWNGKLLEKRGPFDFVEHTTIPDGLRLSVHRCAQTFVKECAKYNFEVRFFTYGGNDQPHDWLRDRLANENFSGAAVFCRSSYQIARPIIEPLMKKHLPVVIMYDDCLGLPIHSINLNNVGLGYDAIRILYRMGHRKIAVIKGQFKRHTERLKGCYLAQSEGGCKDAILHVLSFSKKDPPPAAVQRYFSNPVTRPTAIFALDSGELQGIGALLKRLSLSVPDDISIILYGKQDDVTDFDIPLDAMELKNEEKIGKIAAQQLHRIQSGEALEKSLLINVPYVARGSIKRITPKPIRRQRIPKRMRYISARKST